MKKSIDQVLEECLERILISGESLEQCLRTYPEQAEQLEPLLRTALGMRGVVTHQPRPEFRARAKAQFRSPAEIRPWRRAFPVLGWRHQFATIGLVLLLFMVLGGSTVIAAESAVPDSPLYPVKLATEQVRITLAGSEADKIELHVNFVDRRMVELDYTLNRGNTEKIEQVVRNLDRNLSGISAAEEAEMRPFLRQYARKHNKELRRLFRDAPPHAQKPMLHALRRSWVSYRHALEAVGEDPDVILYPDELD